MPSRDTEEQGSPLQLGMTSELLGDSFLKTLLTRFYHMLQLHSPISHKGLQARPIAVTHLGSGVPQEITLCLHVTAPQVRFLGCYAQRCYAQRGMTVGKPTRCSNV